MNMFWQGDFTCELPFLLGELGVGAAQVGLQVAGRLIGHFDAPGGDVRHDAPRRLVFHPSKMGRKTRFWKKRGS